MTNPIRMCTNAIVAWCADNSAAAKLERTIAQALFGLFSSWVSSLAGAPEIVQVVICPTIMAIMSPVMAYVGNADANTTKIGGTN